MEPRIRSGQTDDLPELIALQSLALKELCTKEYDSKQIAALVDEQARARKAIDEDLFVAEVDGQIVGFSALSKNQAQIGGVYVHPHWTRRGIGQQLIAALEQAAIQKNYRVLTVMASLTAIPFYQAQGYQRQQDGGFWIGTTIWIPCLLMDKRLLPPSFRDRLFSRHWLLILLVLGILGLSLCRGTDRDRPSQYSPLTPPIQESRPF